jgi:hypothetical protein
MMVKIVRIRCLGKGGTRRKLGKMKIFKPESETIRLGEEENKATDHSKFVFYGIHTMIFVGRINKATDSSTSGEAAVQVRAKLNQSQHPLEDR